MKRLIIILSTLCGIAQAQVVGGFLTTAAATASYVPYTGANKAVNLGSQTLKTTGNASVATLSLSSNGTAALPALRIGTDSLSFYSPSTKVLAFTGDNSESTLDNGTEFRINRYDNGAGKREYLRMRWVTGGIPAFQILADADGAGNPNGMAIGSAGDMPTDILVGNAYRWTFEHSAGNYGLYPGYDSLYDIGANSNRVRKVITRALQIGNTGIFSETYTSGAKINFYFENSANTNQTASTNIPNFYVFGNGKTWNTGAITNQYWNYFKANTSVFVAASTITDDYALFIEKSINGSNSTSTNKWGIGCTGAFKTTSGASGATMNFAGGAGTSLLMESNTTNYLNMLQPDADVGGILWGAPSDSFGAFLRWSYSGNKIQISTAVAGGAIEFLTGDAASFATMSSSTGLSFASKAINTTAGDAATIDSPVGRFRKDNSGSTFTLTDSFITANSIIVVTLVSTGITTGNQISVQAGSGTATITFETAGVAAAPSGNCDVNFHVFN